MRSEDDILKEHLAFLDKEPAFTGDKALHEKIKAMEAAGEIKPEPAQITEMEIRLDQTSRQAVAVYLKFAGSNKPEKQWEYDPASKLSCACIIKFREYRDKRLLPVSTDDVP